MVKLDTYLEKLCCQDLAHPSRCPSYKHGITWSLHTISYMSRRIFRTGLFHHCLRMEGISLCFLHVFGRPVSLSPAWCICISVELYNGNGQL